MGKGMSIDKLKQVIKEILTTKPDSHVPYENKKPAKEEQNH